MFVLHSGAKESIVIILGRGLIGAAIERAVYRRAEWHTASFAFLWDDSASQQRETQFQHLLGWIRDKVSGDCSSMHVVWSAGQAGFAAGDKQTNAELRTYRQVVQLSESLKNQLGVETHFHLFSSAGGLFEGIRGIDRQTAPNPMRPYGKLKAAQELIAKEAALSSCSIYRPTSVYSTIQPGKRRGLIPTIIWNTLRNQPTNIFGNHTTLRDYIWADDIGEFLADKLTTGVSMRGVHEFLLATAVPCPISRIVRVVEEMLMRPVPVRYVEPRDANTLDITVSPASLPQGLKATDLAIGIRQIHLRLMCDGVRTDV